MYNWQHKNWPDFEFDITSINDIVLVFSNKIGAISGSIDGLTIKEQQKALIRLMLEEALKTSAIEGEMLSREDVRSSIENHLGLHPKAKNIFDRNAQAITNVMMDVRNNFNTKLSETIIKNWHQKLFEHARAINPGQYRKSTAPMQIVSGSIGKEIVHFEAPPSSQVNTEMKKFVKWYNQYNENGNLLHAMIKTAITHLYFESIHPFEDGNGRIGRALAEKCLSESIGYPVLMSISAVLERHKKNYYKELKSAQKSINITNWIVFFANVLVEAQEDAIKMVQQTIKRTHFFDKHKSTLNERESKVIKKMLNIDNEEFTGGMTAKKYMSITKTSKATATRDLHNLVIINVFIQSGEGRNVHYNLNI